MTQSDSKSLMVCVDNEMTLIWGSSHFSANACLAPICSLHHVAVTTVEGIGSTKSRLHPVQVTGGNRSSGQDYRLSWECEAECHCQAGRRCGPATSPSPLRVMRWKDEAPGLKLPPGTIA